MRRSDAMGKALSETLNRLRGAIGTGIFLAGCTLSVQAQVSVTTWHNDIGRTGQNLNETILNLSDVNPTQFGKLFSQPVDGYVFAEPLYMPNVTIAGQSHNVVFVATENDSVYAFDADSNGGANASPLWFASMLTAAHGAAAGATPVSSTYVGTDIQPQVGITGTPVIDPTTGTLYVVSATLEGSSFVQRLHALDIASGNEKFGGPVFITATVAGTGNGSVNGSLTFDPQWENQRPGLLLLNGIVYIGFSSHGDNGPWHGWVLAYNAQTLAQTGAFCDSHNGVGAGIWMAGAGLAADVVDPVNHPYGRMFIATGNGDYTASKPYTANMDYGDTILNLDLSNGVPNVLDEFTPYNQATLDANDADQASGGVMVVPTQTTGLYPNLLVQEGKSGTLYLLNRDNLGGYNAAGDQVVQEINYAAGQVGTWSTPAYWNGTVYYWGEYDTLKAFPLANGLLGSVSGVSAETYGYPGATPSISANGNSQGIVWSIETDGAITQQPAVLMAHSATSPATTLYSSNTNLTRDNPGAAVKFTVPTIANGKVYVGTETQLSVYGLLNGQQVAAAPTITPVGQSFNGTMVVTMGDSTPGATIYYTLDGSLPTASSTVYTGPITLTASKTIQAIASATGYLQSAVTTESYVDSSQVSPPVLSPGTATYTAPVKVAMSDSTTGASIYFTTDGSVPTTSSTLYSGPVVVSSTETINAIGVAPGFANSNVSSQTYTLNIGQTGIAFTNGFANTTGVVLLNGSTQLNDSRLQLTNGLSSEAGSAWYYQQVNVQAFTTEFSFQLSNPAGDGMTFTIQGSGLNAVGQAGGGLGYQGIPNSVAVKFDLFSNGGEGADSTGLYLNGASPTVPATDMSGSPINLHSDDTMDVLLTYNGTTLTMTITDLVTAGSFTTSWTVNIPSIVGGTTAWVGFTGATGGNTSSQKVETWTYTVGSNSLPVATTPTFSPAGGIYTNGQSVTINDSTPGTTIYYTTNGSTPTTGSTRYTGPVAVNVSETLNAIAVETGYYNSSVGTATYTLGSEVATPTFSIPAGNYSATQTVTIADATPGATIYYTTNGLTPTTSSAVYSGPVTVSQTETLQAIAVLSGYINSALASAYYTFSSGGNIDVNYAAGQFTAGSLSLVDGATVTGGLLQLTNGQVAQSTAGWFLTPVPVTAFVNDFYFEQLNANADGMTFTIQNSSPTAVGAAGAGLGYQTIGNSIAIKFDLFNNGGEGTDSTGLYQNGATPTVPAVNLTGTGIVLLSGHVMHAHMVYNGTNLTMTLTDTVTGATVTEVFPINIPSVVGSNTAYVGFTGGTGGGTSTQNVISWTYADSPGQGTPAPTFSPAAGTYTSPQTVTISDGSSGASIYYTTNGTTPTATSTVYSGPIQVSATETINAIAIGSAGSSSSVTSAAYTITQPQTATPIISPAAGTYASAQTVTISDGSNGATIYYTTNGTTPTASSAVYSGAITVAANETVSAIAVATGDAPSAVASAAYTITTPTPIISPAAGTYASAQTVTISDGSNGATIYYTTNGTTPTTSSPVYAGSITVSASETVSAIAVASGDAPSSVVSAAYTIAPPAATPVFSLAAGTYSTAQTVTISDSTAGATIYYTANGTTPTASSTKYTGSISVANSEMLQAIAVASGYGTSAVGSATYTLAALAPTMSPAAGTYLGTQTVTLTSASPGATIFYTTNGSAASASSTPYTGPITVSASETINAIAAETGWTSSADVAQTYTISTTLSAPTFSPATGTYTAAQTVTIGDATPGASIYYTTNGTTPTSSSTLYSAPVSVGATETLNAIAVSNGVSSAVASASYTITPPAATPVFSVAAGTYTSTQTVAISDATTGATIYYTTNGSTPTTSSTPYSGPVTVSATETLSAIAVATGYSTSAVASAAYTITPPAATPAFSVAAGTYTSTQTVAISDATTSATIYYTTNGSTPTTSSTPYSGPVTVSSTETLSAIAVATGYSNSAVASAAYTITPPAATPVFSLGTGAYNAAQLVTLSDATPGATIYYTANGTTPTTSSTKYTGAITVVVTETLQAIAAAPGYGTSATASATYTLVALPPTMSPGAGTYTGSQSVTIASASSGAKIYYTTNGGKASASSTLYTGPITVSTSETINAVAAETGWTTSTDAAAAYTINAVPATPTFSPAAGTYAVAQNVTISDTSSGVTIYYTTNGTTPTSSSTKYTGPIAVSSTETLQAIAATSAAASPVGTAAYSIVPVAAKPTFSPAPAAYTTTQNVTISDSTPGTTIYYTVNGSAPTTSSSVYSGPIAVSTSETVQAIAVESGYANSATSSATYTIDTAGTTYINYASGGFTSSNLSLNGGATATGGSLQVTDGGSVEARSAWFNTPVPVSSFITDFTFQQLNANGDGMTFTLQGQGLTAVGSAGGGLGYQNIGASAAVKFDLYSNAGEGPDSTGLYTGGASPTVPAIDMSTTGVNLHSGDPMHAHMVYDGTNLTMTLTDTVTNAFVVEVFPVNLPSLIGSSTAYVGFTGGTGGSTATQNVLSWSYLSPAGPIAALPAFSPAAGSYASGQSVAISDATAGATIYYTTNGTVPTTSSSVYTGPISVGSSETLQAIAVESGYTTSAVSSAAYTIGSAGTTYIGYASGGFTSNNLTLNGGATVTGGLLQVTDGGQSESRSAWYSTMVPVTTFTTNFTFQLLNPSADGMTFTIQGQGPTALGAAGGGLGYQNIGNSVAVKFDLYSNSGEGSDSTGLYTGGASPTVPAIDLTTTGINLHSGDTMSAQLVYDGTNLTMTLTDTVTGGQVVEVWPVNIPSLVGANTAYVGFTGGTGGATATQNVLSWSYVH